MHIERISNLHNSLGFPLPSLTPGSQLGGGQGPASPALPRGRPDPSAAGGWKLALDSPWVSWAGMSGTAFKAFGECSLPRAVQPRGGEVRDKRGAINSRSFHECISNKGKLKREQGKPLTKEVECLISFPCLNLMKRLTESRWSAQ